MVKINNIKSDEIQEIQDTKEQTQTLVGVASFSEEFGNLLNISSDSSELGVNQINSENLISPSKTSLGILGDISSLKTDFCYNTLTMDKEDAVFFADLVENTNGNFSVSQQNFSEIISEVEGTEKTKSVTKVLANMLETSMTTQKPVRIDFDNNVSVVMRVDKDGKLSAEFIPGDAAVEQYLKNNISFLKNRLDSQNIAYNDVYYRQNKNNNKKNNKGA